MNPLEFGGQFLLISQDIMDHNLIVVKFHQIDIIQNKLLFPILQGINADTEQ